MTSFTRKCALLVPLLLAPGLSLTAQDIFWTEYGGSPGTAAIKGANINGEDIVDVFTGTEMTSFIVDLDVTDTHLYWTGHSGGDVWRQTLGGNDAARIIDQTAGLLSVHGIEVDGAAGKVYIADHGNITLDPPVVGGIYSTSLDGTSGLNPLWTGTGPWHYTGVTLRGQDQLLWFSRASDLLYIQSTSGGTPDFRTLANAGEIYGIAYDPATDIAYYTNIGTDTLNYYNLSTDEQGTLWTPGMSNPLSVKLSPGGTHLIIAERGRGISGYQLSTGGYELLVAAPNAHFGVAVTADPGDLEVPEPPPPPAEPGDVLFFTDFEEDETESGPQQNWTSAGTPPDGSAKVFADTGNVFGQGVENQYLRVENAHWFDLLAEYEAADVVTLSFDYIGRIHPDDGSRAVNFNLRAGSSNNDRVHVLQINPMSGLVDTVSFGQNDLPYRFDLTVNNSLNEITYDKPDGSGTETLASGFADLWRYDYAGQTWTRLRDDYQNVRHGSVNIGDKMMNFSIQLDSHANRRSFDLDNLYLFKGAVPGHLPREADVSYPPIPYPEVPVLVVHEDFEQYDGPVEITDVSQYMGPFTMRQVQSASSNGSVRIVQDTENRFGRGTDNLVLYMEHVEGTRLDIPIGGLETGVATVAFDMYHEGDFTTTVASATNRLGARFYVKDFVNANIVNNFGIEGDLAAGTYFVRGITAADKRVHPHYVQRWTVVRNNTRDTITYDSPLGPTELSGGFSHVWLNGFLFNEQYGYGDQVSAEEQVITGFRFDAFNSWTAYFDNIRVWEGAIVPDADIQRDVEPAERDLLVYDGFDYSEGTVDGLNGGIGWADGYLTSDGSPSAEVISPGLEWPGLATSGNALSAVGPAPDNNGTRNFRLIDIDGIHSSMLNKYSPTHIGPQGGSIWLSVVGQGNPEQAGTFWGLSLYRDTSEQSGEVLFLGKGSADTEEDGWRFTGGQGSSTGGTIRTGLSLTDRHFWVIRIDYHDDGNQVAHLFHNPDPFGPAPTEPVLSRETRLGSFGFDRIRIAGNGAGFVIDEIRIGTSWEAVAPLGELPAYPEGYANWAALHFPGETHPGIIGPEADPDGDGVTNLIEYMMGMDPTEASRDGLPVLGEVEIEGLRYLTLTGTLPDGTNLDLAVEATSDIDDWSNPDSALPIAGTPNGDGTTTYTFRDVQPIDSNSRRFMRVSAAFKVD